MQTVRKSESQFTQNKDKIIAAFAPEHKVQPNGVGLCRSTLQVPAITHNPHNEPACQSALMPPGSCHSVQS